VRRATAEQFLFAGCLGLSPFISSQFTLEIGVAVTDCKKNIKTPYFKSSRLFKFTADVDTTTKFVTIACYGKQHVCGYMQLLSR